MTFGSPYTTPFIHEEEVWRSEPTETYWRRQVRNPKYRAGVNGISGIPWLDKGPSYTNETEAINAASALAVELGQVVRVKKFVRVSDES